MKVSGKITYDVYFEYEIDDETFNTPDCKDTGYINDWIIEKSENGCHIPSKIIEEITNEKLKDKNIKNFEVIRNDINIFDLPYQVRRIRDKYNIPSDGICDVDTITTKFKNN